MFLRSCANTLTYICHVLGATDWSTETGISLPDFDPSLGTLNSVTLSFAGSLNTTLTIGNISAQTGSPSNSSGTASTQTAFDISSGTLGLPSLPTLSVSAGYPFANLSSSSGSNTISGVQASGSASTGDYDVPTPQIGDFIGTGTVSLPASTTSLTSISYFPLTAVTYAEATGNPSPSAYLTATVTYNYAPSTVPEPSSLAILGAGLAGLLGFFWRRRAARLR